MASERPFRRQAIKLLARVFLGRRRAHYHAWLPSLKIGGRAGGNPGTVFYRSQRVVHLTALPSLQAGARILIIGSGPSAGTLVPQSIPARQALLLNGAISLLGAGLPTPLAVAIEDERFVSRHFDMIAANVSRDTTLLLSPGAIRALCDLDPAFLNVRPVILIDDIRKPYGHPRRPDSELAALDHVIVGGTAGFSKQPDLGVFQGGSVVVSALQFALATSATEIGFIGVDIANADAPRFYERPGAAAFSGVAGAEKRILDHVGLARDVASARGVRLVNHSPVSALASIGLVYEPLA